MNNNFPRWFNLVPLLLCLLVSPGCTRASKTRRLLAAADRDFTAKKYDTAEIEYQTALGMMPLQPEAIRRLGLIYADEGRSPLAAAFLRKANDQDPTNTVVQLKLAEIYAAGGATNEAVRLLKSVCQADPASAQAMLLLAQLDPAQDLPDFRRRLETQVREGSRAAAGCHSALGFIDVRMRDTNAAAGEFQQAVALDPKLASAYQGQAILSYFHRDTNGLEQNLKMAADLSPLRSAVRLKYIDFKVQSRDVKEATNLLNEITTQAPDYLPAWLYSMKLLFAERNFDECKQVIDRILARDNSNFEALLELGTLQLGQHQAAKALETFQRMDGLFPKAMEVKYYLGASYLLNNEKQKAMSALSEALSLNRDYAAAALLLAQVNFRSGRLNETINLLSQVIKSHPDNFKAELDLAEAYMAANQPDRALVVYDQMARLLPKEPEIPLLTGVVYERQGNLAKARSAFEESLALGPDNMGALAQITELDLYQKRFKEAQDRLAGVMERNPKAGEPLLLQGNIYLEQSQTNKAEDSYSKAIELDPDQASAYLKLAKLYVDSHQDQQALRRLDDLIAKTTNAMAMMMVGEIHQMAGRYDQARQAYEKLLAIQPRNYQAMNNLALIYSEYLGDVDRGMQLAEDALKIKPYDPTTADTLGWILYKKRQYANALALIQQCVDRNPLPGAEVEMHLGMTYYMMEEETPARVYLRRALEHALSSENNFPNKQLVRQRLEVLNINPTNTSPAIEQELQSLMNDNPDDPVPLSRLAAIQEQRGDIDGAIESLQKLLSINNQVWPAMIRLSRLYADQKHDLRKALELAKAAHVLAPDEPSACAWVGELVYRSGADYPWAVSLLQQAAQQSFHQPAFNYYLGLGYYAIGHVDQADAAMEKELAQNDPQPFPGLAKQFLALRAAAKDPAHAQSAASTAQQVLAKDPNDVPALMVTALLAEHQGARDEALKTYDKILTIFPAFAPAMRQMAIIYSRGDSSRDLDKAYDLAEKARAAQPDDPELGRVLGLLAYRRADYNMSMLLLQESTRKFNKDGEVFYYLGMDCYQLKQSKECKKALLRALDLGVPDPLASQARRVIQEIKG